MKTKLLAASMAIIALSGCQATKGSMTNVNKEPAAISKPKKELRICLSNFRTAFDETINAKIGVFVFNEKSLDTPKFEFEFNKGKDLHDKHRLVSDLLKEAIEMKDGNFDSLPEQIEQSKMYDDLLVALDHFEEELNLTIFTGELILSGRVQKGCPAISRHEKTKLEKDVKFWSVYHDTAIKEIRYELEKAKEQSQALIASRLLYSKSDQKDYNDGLISVRVDDFVGSKVGLTIKNVSSHKIYENLSEQCKKSSIDAGKLLPCFKVSLKDEYGNDYKVKFIYQGTEILPNEEKRYEIEIKGGLVTDGQFILTLGKGIMNTKRDVVIKFHHPSVMADDI